MPDQKIVILGAGFAGLTLARKLQKSGCEITLIDQYNFHQFQPLFYQVATARLEPSSVSFPLRKVFQRRRNVHVRVSRVNAVDTAAKVVHTDTAGDFPYDYLVIATGCTTNFFGNKNIEQHAYPMKSTTEATTIRNRLLLNFEDAIDAPPDVLEGIMNIVIAGGGPTGVEMAGSIAEMKKNVLPRDYPDMDFSKLNIYLIEGSAHTLNVMSEPSKRKSQEYLEKMGVKLLLNTIVKDYDGQTLSYGDGQKLPTRLVLWTAGVMGNVPPGIDKSLTVRGGRIKTDDRHRVPGLDGVFAIGDVSYMETPGFPQGHPQLGNVANHEGAHCAATIKALMAGKETTPFKYKNPGTMATVGKRKAVVDLPFIKFQGFLAWLTWMFLHLMLIVSVKNRLVIFINWAMSYFTNDTTLRLILLPTRKQVELAVEHKALPDAVKGV